MVSDVAERAEWDARATDTAVNGCRGFSEHARHHCARVPAAKYLFESSDTLRSLDRWRFFLTIRGTLDWISRCLSVEAAIADLVRD